MSKRQDLERGRALIAAVRKRHSRRVNELLSQGACADTRTDDGTPVLWLAVADDDAFTVINLLGAGADPNSRDAAGRSIASIVRTASTARLLIERGLDIGAEGFDSATLLQVAARGGDEDLVQELLARGVPLPKKMLLTNFWSGLGPKSEQVRRLINAHRMAGRLTSAMSGSEEEAPSKPSGGGVSPL